MPMVTKRSSALEPSAPTRFISKAVIIINAIDPRCKKPRGLTLRANRRICTEQNHYACECTRAFRGMEDSLHGYVPYDQVNLYALCVTDIISLMAQTQTRERRRMLVFYREASLKHAADRHEHCRASKIFLGARSACLHVSTCATFRSCVSEIVLAGLESFIILRTRSSL